MQSIQTRYKVIGKPWTIKDFGHMPFIWLYISLPA